jgi:hypothetical protein
VGERPLLFRDDMCRAVLDGRKDVTRRVGPTWAKVQPGTRLWVREAWRVHEAFDSKRPALFLVRYEADGLARTVGGSFANEVFGRYRHARFMPRWASRITLEITGVRVERVQDISAKDIIAEGAVLRAHQDKYLGKMPVSSFDKKAYPDLRSLWAHAWRSIYAGTANDWGHNPLVWVLEWKPYVQKRN